MRTLLVKTQGRSFEGEIPDHGYRRRFQNIKAKKYPVGYGVDDAHDLDDFLTLWIYAIWTKECRKNKPIKKTLSCISLFSMASLFVYSLSSMLDTSSPQSHSLSFSPLLDLIVLALSLNFLELFSKPTQSPSDIASTLIKEKCPDPHLSNMMPKKYRQFYKEGCEIFVDIKVVTLIINRA